VKRSFLSDADDVLLAPGVGMPRIPAGTRLNRLTVWWCTVIKKRVCAASSNRIASKRVWSRTACKYQAKGMRNQCRSGVGVGGRAMSTGVFGGAWARARETDDRQQWLQTARVQYECRKRCRTATRSVSQADVANGLANRSGRAAYLSETRSDVRSSGARSRLCEWLGPPV
jgi:hypothetical protein